MMTRFIITIILVGVLGIVAGHQWGLEAGLASCR
jgi:hypothetical protein